MIFRVLDEVRFKKSSALEILKRTNFLLFIFFSSLLFFFFFSFSFLLFSFLVFSFLFFISFFFLSFCSWFFFCVGRIVGQPNLSFFLNTSSFSLQWVRPLDWIKSLYSNINLKQKTDSKQGFLFTPLFLHYLNKCQWMLSLLLVQLVRRSAKVVTGRAVSGVGSVLRWSEWLRRKERLGVVEILLGKFLLCGVRLGVLEIPPGNLRLKKHGGRRGGISLEFQRC